MEGKIKYKEARNVRMDYIEYFINSGDGSN